MNINIKKIKELLTFKDIKTKQELFEDYANSNNNNDNIIKKITSKIKIFKGDSIIGEDVYNDIEFFQNFSNNSQSKTVFDIFLNNFNLMGSKYISKDILLYPSNDIKLLNKRKDILEIFENKLKLDNDSEYFKILKHNEQNILWLFEKREQHIEDLLNIVFFRFYLLKNLNSSSNALTIYNIYRIILSPLIGILSPIIYFIIPYLIIIWKFGLNISFISYLKLSFKTMMIGSQVLFNVPGLKYVSGISYFLSLIFYFQGLFNSIEVSRTLYKLCKHIISKFNGVVKYMKSAYILINKYWTEDFNNTFIEFTSDIKDTMNENEYIVSLLDKDFSLFSNFGILLHGYKFINKDLILSVYKKTIFIDSIYSFLLTKKQYNLTFSKFIISDKPSINCKEIYHPCIKQDNIVKNDLILNNNIIITGPNAGGKSTFIKSLLISILLSQTICMSIANEFILTPFKNINSQINIPDSKGYESLFEAEMHRCLRNLNILKDNNDFTFIIMDEIFNSTNPVEGISAAYAIANKISNYDKCILVFTTHYLYLTKLEKNTNKFINYKMNIEFDNNNNIIFPYKLSRGYSKQYIALELLKKNGFDENIINEAIQIKNKLTN